MPIYYMDTVNGSDANTGANWGQAWKTITSGATFARIAPGDEIRIAKSPDPINIGNVTFTDNSATLTLATAKTLTVDLCDAAWTALPNVTCTSEPTIKKEGTNSAKQSIAVGFVGGLIAYKNFAAKNLSTYTKLTFWIYSTTAQAAGILQILLDDTNGCVSPLETINLPRISPSMWTPCTVTLSNPAALTAIVSVGLYSTADPGTVIVFIDNIEACNSDLNLTCVIGKNSVTFPENAWFGIKSIVGTTVILNDEFSGVNATQTGYTRQCILWNANSNDWSIQDSGTAGNLISFKGGYNTSTSIQDGYTFWMGQSLNTYGTIETNSRGYLYISNMGFCYFDWTNNALTSGTTTFENMHYVSIGTDGAKSIFYGGGTASTFLILNNVIFTGCDAIMIYAVVSGATYDFTNIAILTPIPAATTFSITGTYGNEIYIKNFYLTNNSSGSPLWIAGGRIYIDGLYTKYHTSPIFTGTMDLIVSVHNWNSTTDTFVTVPFGSVVGDIRNYYLTLDSENGDSNVHRRYNAYGTIESNSSQARSGLCAKMIPGSSIHKLKLYIDNIIPEAGVSNSIGVYIKKSADYNGNNPTLVICKYGIPVATPTPCSVTTSYVLYSVSYIPSEVVALSLEVACDGTVGSIYVDDLEVSV